MKSTNIGARAKIHMRELAAGGRTMTTELLTFGL